MSALLFFICAGFSLLVAVIGSLFYSCGYEDGYNARLDELNEQDELKRYADNEEV